MAVKKATTTADLQGDPDAQPPTYDEQVAGYEDVTSPAMVAEVTAPDTVRLTSPAGFVTEVPSTIAGVLKDSGYKAAK